MFTNPSDGLTTHSFGPRCGTPFTGWWSADGSTLSALHPDERIYTFWDYFRNAWVRNAGLRIDSSSVECGSRKTLARRRCEPRGSRMEKASDHAPAWIELSAGKTASATRAGERRAPRARNSRGRPPR